MQRAKDFLIRNKYFSLVYYSIKFYLSSLLGKEPLIIFQMGKVGSSTIAESLRCLGLYGPVYHIHYLSDEGIKGSERVNKFHQWEYRFLSKKINTSPGKKWKVISLVRESVGRNISAFYQNIDLTFHDFTRSYIDGSISAGECVDHFFKKYGHDIPLMWFDSEMKRVFGIDVFASDFPRSKGYKIYEGERATLLLLKLEKLNECAEDAFKEFLGVKKFSLSKANIGSEKAYADAYAEFKNSVVVPDTYIEEMYSSRYMHHFYSEEEIIQFKKKWSR